MEALDSVPSLILDTSDDDWLQEVTEPPVNRTSESPIRTPQDENSRKDRSPIRPSRQPVPGTPSTSSVSRPPVTTGTKARPYLGVALISDGSCLNSTHYADLHEHFPGISTRIINYLRLEDVPGILDSISPTRRQIVIIFVGSRDVFGAPEIHYRRSDKPDRAIVAFSHLAIQRGLRVLNRASTAPADRTYLCTIPHRAPFTPTSDRLYLNAVHLFQATAFNIIHTASFDFFRHQRFFDPPTGKTTPEGRDHFINCIKSEVSRQLTTHHGAPLPRPLHRRLPEGTGERVWTEYS